MVAMTRLVEAFQKVNPLRGRSSAATEVDQVRGEHMHGHPFTQTADEQAGTRQRMEAELDAQRQRRAR
jgi:hypothetical protein